MRGFLERVDGFALNATGFARVLVPPVAISLGTAAGIWAFAHPGRMAAMAKNALTADERQGALIWLAITALVVVGVYAVSFLASHLKGSDKWSSRPTTQFLSCLLTIPFLAALSRRSIESVSPKLAVFYIVCATAAMVPLLLLASQDSKRDPARPAQGIRTYHRSDFAYFGLVLVAVVAYAWFFSHLSITNHHALNTRGLDLGIYDNIFYQSAHGRPLDCTLIRLGNHISAHFDPILVLLSPLYYLYPRAELLLVLQSVWVALGAVPAFLLGRRVIGSAGAGAILAFAYLLGPALHGANLYDFHSLTLFPTTMLWAIFFLESGRNKSYWFTFLILLATREDISLILIFFGVSMLLTKAPRLVRTGWVTIVLSAVYFVLVRGLLMSTKGGYGYTFYYRDLIPKGEGVEGLFVSVATNPVYALTHALSEAKINYLLVLMVPLLLLPLFAKARRFVLLYGLAFLLFASRKYVPSPHFQYSMVIYPFLIGLTPFALERIRDGELPRGIGVASHRLVFLVLGGVLVSSLLFSWKFGGVVSNTSFRGGFRPVAHQLNDTQLKRYAQVRELADKIEPGASVAVTDLLAPHVTNRAGAFPYPTRQKTDYLFISKREVARRRAEHARFLKEHDFKLVAKAGEFELLKRSSKSSAPAALPAK